MAKLVAYNPQSKDVYLYTGNRHFGVQLRLLSEAEYESRTSPDEVLNRAMATKLPETPVEDIIELYGDDIIGELVELDYGFNDVLEAAGLDAAYPEVVTFSFDFDTSEWDPELDSYLPTV